MKSMKDMRTRHRGGFLAPHTLPHITDRPPGGEGQERLSVFLRFVIFMCFMVRDGASVNNCG
jgi:hypothetical protein